MAERDISPSAAVTGSSCNDASVNASRAGTARIREAQLDDFRQIAMLTAAHGLAQGRTEEQWRHLWLANPAYLKVRERWPLGWVIESNARIVGYIGSLPSLYKFRGRQLVCASGHGWAVDSGFRGHSLFLLDRYFRRNSADLVMSNTIDQHADAALCRLGALPVPAGRWNRIPVWITSYRPLIADRCARRGLSRALAEAIAAPTSLALTVKDSWNRIRLSAQARSGSVEFCSSFDARFDDFWRNLCALYPDKLLAMRDRETLEWHFHFALMQKRAWILTLSRGSQLRAYAILVQAISRPSDPIRRATLADFQSLEPNPREYYILLRAALRKARHEGIHLVSTMGFSAGGIDISSLAPYCNLRANCAFRCRVKNPELVEALADPQVWCPTLYDSDATVG